MNNQKEPFPDLPLEAWEQSKITLHLWLQIAGKVKLDLMPRRNHWWNITLLVSPKGITSGSIPHAKGSFQFDFDFSHHLVEFTTSWGQTEFFPLHDGLSVAAFHKKFFTALDNLGVEAKITPIPYDHPCKEPFHTCETYHSYEEDYVYRFWQVLVWVDNVFRKFSGQFYGKVSPSQIFWHHMDLAITRFSGEAGPEMPDSATVADKEAYSHEVISAGFWAGDEVVRDAAFYSYTYPSPDGLDGEKIKPEKASWVDNNGSPMALLMYDDLIRGLDPEKDLMDFLESTYRAGAKLARWPGDLVRQ